MKRLTTLASILIAASGYALGTNFISAAEAPAVQAAPPPPSHDGANAPGQRPQRAFVGERLQQLRERFDSNNDGAVDQAEREAARAAIQQRRREQLGANAQRQEVAGNRPLPRFKGPAVQRFKARVDANRDGHIDEVEREEARKLLRERIMQRFDFNHDAQLGNEERQAIRESLRHRIRGRIEGRMMQRQQMQPGHAERHMRGPAKRPGTQMQQPFTDAPTPPGPMMRRPLMQTPEMRGHQMRWHGMQAPTMQRQQGRRQPLRPQRQQGRDHSAPQPFQGGEAPRHHHNPASPPIPNLP